MLASSGGGVGAGGSVSFSRSLSSSPSPSPSPLNDEISSRPLTPSDRPALEAMFEECFPIKYNDNFYESAVLNVGHSDAKKPIVTIALCMSGGAPVLSSSPFLVTPSSAFPPGWSAQGKEGGGVRPPPPSSSSPPQQQQQQQEQHPTLQKRGNAVSPSPSPPTSSPPPPPLVAGGEDREQPDLSPLSLPDENFFEAANLSFPPAEISSTPFPTTSLVGVLIGQFVIDPSTQPPTVPPSQSPCDHYSHSLLSLDPSLYPLTLYVMSLAVSSSRRGHGLGTRLLSLCDLLASSNRQCGAIWLHVIVYNSAAISLYEKAGYENVGSVDDYYAVDGKLWAAYVFVKYLHGAEKKRTTSTIIAGWWGGVKKAFERWNTFS